jgi:hypothetical protein
MYFLDDVDDEDVQLGQLAVDAEHDPPAKQNRIWDLFAQQNIASKPVA